EMLADQARIGEADKVVNHLDSMNQKYIDAVKWYTDIDQRKQEADRRHELDIKKLEEMAANHRKLEEVKQQGIDLKRQIEQQGQANQMAAMKPESIMALGQQWAMDPNGKIPTMGNKRGPADYAFRTKVIEAGVEWAKSNGIDPSQLPQLREELRGARRGIGELSKQIATQEATIRRFDAHAKTMLELSKKVPRTELPALNTAILNGQKNYQGSPEAAEYVAQAYDLGQELARVVLPSSSQGDANTRKDAREAISASYNHEQLTAVINRFRNNGAQAIEQNRVALRSQTDLFSNFDRYSKPGATNGADKPKTEEKPKPAAKSREITVNGKKITVTEEP
ncbi:MAG TPA: hypothetical protein VF238_11045, partial [Methylomirabilota bacterium]